MTENQVNEMFRLMNTAIGKISNIEKDVAVLKADVSGLKSDVAVLKSDVAELKEGQARLEAGQSRLEKEIQITNRALDRLAGESVRVQARVDIPNSVLIN
jgi:chromosome segregation ATPase